MLCHVFKIDIVWVVVGDDEGTYRFTLLPSSPSLSRVSHDTLLGCESDFWDKLAKFPVKS